MEEKKKNQKKRRLAVLASILALLALLVGTFAWLTSRDEAKNHFKGKLAGNDIQIVEDFTPPTEWPPNGEIKKEAGALNVSKYDAFVRMGFAETLAMLKDGSEKQMTAAELSAATGSAIAMPRYEPDAALKKSLDKVFRKKADGTEEQIKASVTDGNYKGEWTLKADYVMKDEKGPKGEDLYRYSLYWEKDGTATEKYSAKFVAPASTIPSTGTPGEMDKLIVTDATFRVFDGVLDTASNKLWSEKSGSKNAPWDTLAVTKPVAADIVWSTTNPEEATIMTKTIENDGTTPGKIQIKLQNLAKTPTADKWFYNEPDGNFYYVALVPAGSQTAPLVKSVKLLGTAGNEYSLVEYDLTIFAKGIQGMKDAVESEDWLGTTGNAALVTALKNVGLESKDADL